MIATAEKTISGFVNMYVNFRSLHFLINSVIFENSINTKRFKLLKLFNLNNFGGISFYEEMRFQKYQQCNISYH